jgi:hypothetical protein
VRDEAAAGLQQRREPRSVEVHRVHKGHSSIREIPQSVGGNPRMALGLLPTMLGV